MDCIHIGLVGCVKDKQEVPAPAWQLYTSPLFRGSFAEAVLRCGRSRVWILSAQHGLVDLERVLEPYNMALGDDVPSDWRQVWGKLVAEELTERVPANAPVVVHVYAGGAYLESLRPHLPAGWVVVSSLEGELGERLSQLSRLRELREQPRPVTPGAFDDAAGLELVLLAMEIEQHPGRPIYSFAVEARQVARFATASRMRRVPGGMLFGYQRPQVRKHIQEIMAYLRSAHPLVPGSPVLALGKGVRFEPLPGPHLPGGRHGHLIIRLPAEGTPEQDMPAFIVDGQQRISAFARAGLPDFRVAVTAFFSESVAEQATQFILANNVQPVPSAHVYELLPYATAELPPALEALRLPALLVERLGLEVRSPLRGLISSASSPAGLLKDASLLRAVRSSLAGGALRPLLGLETGAEADVEGMFSLLVAWWSAVREVFPEAWARPPEESRLFLGAGVAALGALLDAAAAGPVASAVEQSPRGALPSQAELAKALRKVAPFCCWTAGAWSFDSEGVRQWDKVQNTPQDVEMLSVHLVRLYREQKGSNARPRRRCA